MRVPSVRWLLVGVNAFVLAVPLFALAGLRIYDTYLVRQTERQLIAQAVVIGEIWRNLYLEETGESEVPAFRAPEKASARYAPVEPVLDLSFGILPPQAQQLRPAPKHDSPELRAGIRLTPLLLRAQVFNLSAVRILDARGCVVATTRGEADLCMDDLPEVRAALDGHYTAVARQRISDQPLPPVADVRSRGSVRVFSALPIFADGRVIGVVRVSRTSLDALTSLWHNRRGLLWAAAASMGLTVLVSIIFASLIGRPLTRITRTASAIAKGAPHTQLALGGFAPAEVRALGEALEVMTQKLQDRAQHIAEFAANVSHELKTPLTGIRGAAELLRDSWREMSEAQRMRFVSNIDADAAHMDRLVTRLLHLARIEAATEGTESIDVQQFFGALVGRLGGRVQLVVNSPPQRITMDAEHLSSAVSNLLDNALRHDASGPVRLSLDSEAGRLRLQVEDCGPGIKSANRERIFERFFTTRRDEGGTGLGLAIVKAIAERRGGYVRVESRPGRTVFTLLL